MRALAVAVRRRTATALLLAAALAPPVLPAALHAQADTIAGPPSRLFTRNDALLAGGVALLTLAVRPLDDRLYDIVRDSSTQANRRLRQLGIFVRTTTEASAVIGGTMYLAGRIGGNERLADVGLHGTEALLIGEAVAVVLKGVVGRQRPSVGPRDSRSYGLMRGFRKGDDYRSFPSGHTVAAFAAAAAVTSEASRYAPGLQVPIGAALYGGAALVGLSRMYDNRHWATDVIMGAGIGTFAGLKTVRWQHTHPGNRLDDLLLTGSLVPTSGGGRAVRWLVLPGALARPR